MTADARTLTARATAAAPAATATISAHDVRVLLDGLARLGYEADALQKAAGLQLVDFRNPDARVPCAAYGDVLARAQRQRVTTNLALELARVTPLGAWPLIDYLVLTSETVGAGVRQLARYIRLTSAPFGLDVREENAGVDVELTGTPGSFAIEFELALIVLRLRDEAGPALTPAVHLAHSPDDPVAFAAALGCPVVTDASWNGLRMAVDSWQLRLRRRDPILREMLEGHANDALARLPRHEGLAAEVTRVLVARLAGGDLSLESIGRDLALSARSLQRRLAAEGHSYQQLLDDARRGAAQRYVTESALAIGEISFLLGYSEPAPFHRAFKRWFGRTPDAVRREARPR